MLFNSLDFLLFFPLVCFLYWIMPHKLRNSFLLIASYYFYMSWNVTYGLLIFLSTVVTWSSARIINSSFVKRTAPKRKKNILFVCLLINLGLLFVFKYANFFVDTISFWGDYFNFGLDLPNLNFLLPVGISFYTFQAIGYTIDVYKGTIQPEKNFFVYALFVSFFPQLVAGPIERAKNLLPQFHEKHLFDGDKAMKGIQLMLWGYFMKLCIADRGAVYVDSVFNNLEQHGGTSVLLASFLFTIQIYCDFCGYSLIAIGAAKVIGFNLMENFHRPYFSTNIKEFWKRWHISLSTWFMDYVYVPLGGNRCCIQRHCFNLFITFVISGMWHGANWTFLIWGIYHGVLIILTILFSKYGLTSSYNIPFKNKIKGLFTFFLVLVGWIFFRVNNVTDLTIIIDNLFSKRDLLIPQEYKQIIISIILLFLVELSYEYKIPIKLATNRQQDIAAIFLIFVILLLGVFSSNQFIYFQF